MVSHVDLVAAPLTHFAAPLTHFAKVHTYSIEVDTHFDKVHTQKNVSAEIFQVSHTSSFYQTKVSANIFVPR